MELLLLFRCSYCIILLGYQRRETCKSHIVERKCRESIIFASTEILPLCSGESTFKYVRLYHNGLSYLFCGKHSDVQAQ